MGGIAGGEKFIVHNIVFKFAVDCKGLYGWNDEAAATVAGHELKGLQAYFNCSLPHICLPLMALLDYRGFRLIAVSLLPLSSNSLVYGSADAGRTVHTRNPYLNTKLAAAAVMLNIKPHMGGKK